MNGSNPERCICLRNIVKSKIFQTDQKSIWGYESAALTAELQALRLLQHLTVKEVTGHAERPFDFAQMCRC
jgi:hypothetical protein